MSIKLNADKFGQHGRAFTFGFKDSVDSACSANTASEEVMLSADFTQCGIVQTVEDGSIKYSQTLYVTYGVNPESALVYRQERISFEVECVQSTNVEAGLDGAYVNVSSLEEQTVSQCKKTYMIFCL